MACIVRAMASPLQSRKSSVNLAAPTVRVSRIRRDPPPKPAKIDIVDTEENEQWALAIGILAFALAIVVVIFAFGTYSTWSPSEYTIEVNAND